MAQTSFTDFRQHMATYFDKIADARQPLLVTRQGGKGNVVVMSEAEFAGWQETVALLSSPKNAKRLMASVRQAKAGAATERELLASGKAPLAT